MIILGLTAAVAAGVMAVALAATRRALWRPPPDHLLRGIAPDDVAELSSTMQQTAHLYSGFGRTSAAPRAVRVLHRTGRQQRPRVGTVSTLECRTLGRSTWFRLENGTAVRVDEPVATISGDDDTETVMPDNLLEDAHLVAAQRHADEVVIHFRDAGVQLELRGTGAAIL